MGRKSNFRFDSLPAGVEPWSMKTDGIRSAVVMLHNHIIPMIFEVDSMNTVVLIITLLFTV